MVAETGHVDEAAKMAPLVKLHMVSIVFNGQRHVRFIMFPAGVRPFVPDSLIAELAIEPGRTFSVGA